MTPRSATGSATGELPSPYFGEEHAMLRAQLRRFVNSEVKPHAAAWEQQGFVPREVLRGAWANSDFSASAIRSSSAAATSTRAGRLYWPRSLAAPPSAALRSRRWSIPTWPRCTSPMPGRRSKKHV